MQFVRVGNVLVPVKRQRATCFSGGTLVRTKNGLKAIADLSGRDRVLCDLNGIEIDAEIQTVTKMSSDQGFEAIVLATDKEDVVVTPDHAVGLASGGFAFVSDLKKAGGGILRTFGGRVTEVKVKGYAKLMDIYNVIIAEEDANICYSVGGVNFAASDRL